MENLTKTNAPTLESVWAALQETNRQIQENERIRQENERIRQENERILKEQFAKSDRIMKKRFAELDRIRKEKIAEEDRQRKEEERAFKEKIAEEDRQRKEEDRTFKEKIAEEDHQRKEERAFKEKIAEEEKIRKENQKASDRRWKKIEETMGSWANNHGQFAEEYFSNSFEDGKQNFFGEKFDDINLNVKGIKKGYKDEYDILLINGKSVGIIEVKFKAHENDIPKILKKAQTFRVNFTEYENHKVYLGLATMCFYPELEALCRKEGIAIVKQVGDSVVLNDKHLKVF